MVDSYDINSLYPETITLHYGSLRRGWERVGIDMILDATIYSVGSRDIQDWIESHPNHMWKHYVIPETARFNVSISALTGTNYFFTEEMEAWFMLRWS